MLRLPVKSLLRFKSVSKTRYNHIKDHSFTKQHLLRSKENTDTFTAVLSTAKKNEKPIFRVNFTDALDKPVDLDLPFMSDCIEVLGICDGLVCLMTTNKLSFIYICNPLTGEYRQVPNIDGRTYLQITVTQKHTSYFGFGLNGDKGYELFKIVYKYSHDGKLIPKGDVYSLTTNNWTKINVKKGETIKSKSRDSPCTSFEPVPVFLHGVFYWVVTDFDSGYVVYFDIEKGVFDEVWCPGECSERHWMLRNLYEKLALVLYHYLRDAFDIYVFDVEDKSWREIFVFEEDESIAGISNYSVVTVLGYSRSGELVVEDFHDKISELFLYDMDNDDAEELPCVNASENKDDIFMFTESLISVNVGEEASGTDSN